MRDSVMWFLVSAVLISALFVVYMRHQHRIAYVAYQASQTHRDALSDEWGQLVIEENLWAFAHRIEKDASQRLGMRAPTKKEVVYLQQTQSDSIESNEIAEVTAEGGDVKY